MLGSLRDSPVFGSIHGNRIVSVVCALISTPNYWILTRVDMIHRSWPISSHFPTTTPLPSDTVDDEKSVTKVE